MTALTEAVAETFAPDGELARADSHYVIREAQICMATAVAQAIDGQHALVARITTDWWRSHLLGDAAARARLLNPSGLNSQDIWQTG